ncbi:MAG: alpha/beta hydrolase, partial [Planctomycetota bacterium]|nr:alpha/beta hydrolase [Planctomycetota bacterium]
MALVLVLAGCQSGFKPVPLPLGLGPVADPQRHQVLFATDRALLTQEQIEARREENNPDPYGPGRSRTPSYGVGHVVLEPDQKSGGLVPVLESLDRWDGGSRTFFKQLSQRASGRDVVVFVHGFNNSLREATFRAALLAQYL